MPKLSLATSSGQKPDRQGGPVFRAARIALTVSNSQHPESDDRRHEKEDCVDCRKIDKGE